jgi:hypothetical protein
MQVGFEDWMLIETAEHCVQRNGVSVFHYLYFLILKIYSLNIYQIILLNPSFLVNPKYYLPVFIGVVLNQD